MAHHVRPHGPVIIRFEHAEACYASGNAAAGRGDLKMAGDFWARADALWEEAERQQLNERKLFPIWDEPRARRKRAA